MQIIIKTLTGKCQSLNFEPTNTIADVKDVLRERECIDPGQIRLIYSGKQMSDELTLNDYKVVPGSTIHMVLQLRGG
ncbi:ubiquitin-like protein (NEDD8 homologue), putative [Theileria annulata]|uniref:Ubiquitin-like protein (NEDD8 homologue), putative n=1 Tax=Theileria annulata TaxID=5874 RepID=Q4UEV1_THEAN|nr:ubiquitin-like protein (NEDD8 homologue), putative [Theileria annulata]CAI74388.1 ubiquitin-like protein (NEDD8 homologue), putative [Theileria annulata]|eukprot:XP_952120.1 ubiquitin-like protein (NEDD8 homologue), putative [Theileria annulata]